MYNKYRKRNFPAVHDRERDGIMALLPCAGLQNDKVSRAFSIGSPDLVGQRSPSGKTDDQFKGKAGSSTFVPLDMEVVVFRKPRPDQVMANKGNMTKERSTSPATS